MPVIMNPICQVRFDPTNIRTAKIVPLFKTGETDHLQVIDLSGYPNYELSE